ncbi:hypothetical protein KSC_003250 [Ktedonobacter sp. SOSP1-52]|nr:hypothetical protein KSC_003250 [Ktedonobacter sp. SOSP1-52]
MPRVLRTDTFRYIYQVFETGLEARLFKQCTDGDFLKRFSKGNVSTWNTPLSRGIICMSVWNEENFLVLELTFKLTRA